MFNKFEIDFDLEDITEFITLTFTAKDRKSGQVFT